MDDALALPMPRRIVVTGCPRSGTGHIAALLRRLGISCGHAEHFNPQRLELGVPPWPSELAGEASWYAAPYGECLPAGTVVVHIVRSPSAALASLWRSRLFCTRSTDRSFLERHAPVLMRGTPLQQTARIWSQWNQLAETARETTGMRYLRVRLEALDESSLRWIAALAERELDLERARSAVAELSRSTAQTAREAVDSLAEWSDLRGTDLLREIDELAARYGYGPAALSGLLARRA